MSQLHEQIGVVTNFSSDQHILYSEEYYESKINNSQRQKLWLKNEFLLHRGSKIFHQSILHLQTISLKNFLKNKVERTT